VPRVRTRRRSPSTSCSRRFSGLTLETVVKGTITPLIVMIAVLLVITYVPALSLALPAFFGM